MFVAITRKNIQDFIRIFCYAILLTGIYYSAYTWLVAIDWARDDYSASMLIPAVSLYLIWEKRNKLAEMPSKGSWGGIIIIIFSILFFWIGELAGEYFTLYVSSWGLVIGLCLLHMGWHKIKVIAFPLFLLLCMFPLPNFIHTKLSFKLKLISSQLGVKIMQFMGMSVYREGNVIDLGFTQLQVVDACNGLRYLIPLVILGLIIAYFYKTIWWKRFLLVLSTIPIAVLVNSLRIASVGVLYRFLGPMVAEGFFHDFSGWFIFMLTVGFLFLFMCLLKLLPPKSPNQVITNAESPSNPHSEKFAEKQEAGKSQNDCKEVNSTIDDSGKQGSFFSLHFIAACLLLIITLGISLGVNFHEHPPIRRPLFEFPTMITDWKGSPVSMEQKFIDELDLSDYRMVEFTNGDGRLVNFYVAYYDSQRKGESIHSPATCMPASGWVFNQSGKMMVPLENGEAFMPVKRAFMQKGEQKQLSYFWFPMRGRVLTNAYEMKWFNFWDALTRQRTDGSLVRVITPVYPDEALEMTEKRLQQFVGDLLPILEQFLPQ